MGAGCSNEKQAAEHSRLRLMAARGKFEKDPRTPNRWVPPSSHVTAASKAAQAKNNIHMKKMNKANLKKMGGGRRRTRKRKPKSKRAVKKRTRRKTRKRPVKRRRRRKKQQSLLEWMFS